MKTGELKHPIIIQLNTRVANNEGITVDGWADSFTAYAKIKTISNRREDSGQPGGLARTESRYEFTIRYRTGFNAKDYRVKYRSRIFIIESEPVNTNEANEELVLACAEFKR